MLYYLVVLTLVPSVFTDSEAVSNSVPIVDEAFMTFVKKKNRGTPNSTTKTVRKNITPMGDWGGGGVSSPPLLQRK